MKARTSGGREGSASDVVTAASQSDHRSGGVRTAALLTSLLALVSALLGACTADGREESEPTGGATDASVREPMRLEVLVYNVEYGGNESTDAVIESIDADIVGVLESYNRLPEIAENTAYPYYNVSLQILSKYPIHEPSGAEGRYALIEVRPGQVVAFFNIHLDYVQYGPRLLRNGATVEEVIASENKVRTSALDVPLRLMRRLIDEGYPVVFTGDHNEPSSLDWTQATAGVLPGIAQPVPWPVSEALLDVGFRDTYREIHPDPVDDPGITHKGTGDRIDYLYAAGPVETIDSELVGEEGGRDVQIGFDRWTSDHRAVLSRLEVRPMAMPITVSANPALLTQGDPLTVGYNAPGEEGSVSIGPSGEGVTSPEMSRELTRSTGTFDVDTSRLAPGGHDAVLLGADGSQMARVGFWVRDPNARIKVSTDKRSYRVGEPIVVSWSDGPANRWDWIGIYRAAKSNPRVDYYLLWNYTGLHESGTLPPSVSGSVRMDKTAQGGPWPMPSGRYVVHYLVTDRYRTIGSANFQVTA